jgi:hypothetical protein
MFNGATPGSAIFTLTNGDNAKFRDGGAGQTSAAEQQVLKYRDAGPTVRQAPPLGKGHRRQPLIAEEAPKRAGNIVVAGSGPAR